MAIKAAPRTDSRLAARCAALASFGAAIVHFVAVPAHWREWILAGAFFAVLAVFQLVWARLVLIRTTAPVLLIGALVNAAVIVLWALSRTAGVPFGPHAGQPEIVQGADLSALLLQTYVVMGASWTAYRGRNAGPISPFASATVLAGAVGVITLASTVGVVSGQRHGDHHGPAEASTNHHGVDAGPAASHDGHHDHPVGSVPPPREPVQQVQAPRDEVRVAPSEPRAETSRPPVQPLHDHADHDHGG